MIVRIFSTKVNALGEHEEVIKFDAVTEIVERHPLYILKSKLFNSDVYIECPVDSYLVVNKGEEK